MKTYKYYLKSSECFLNDSKLEVCDAEHKEYYYLVSILLSWIGLESYINSISESLSLGTRLTTHQKLFLQEKELRLNDECIFIEHKTRPATCNKILFLINYFSKVGIKKFKASNLWQKIKNLEDLRNKIVHHKEENNISVDYEKAREYFDVINETIRYLNKAIFKK